MYWIKLSISALSATAHLSVLRSPIFFVFTQIGTADTREKLVRLEKSYQVENSGSRSTAVVCKETIPSDGSLLSGKKQDTDYSKLVLPYRLQ